MRFEAHVFDTNIVVDRKLFYVIHKQRLGT
jgi:hypothetical protein